MQPLLFSIGLLLTLTMLIIELVTYLNAKKPHAPEYYARRIHKTGMMESPLKKHQGIIVRLSLLGVGVFLFIAGILQ